MQDSSALGMCTCATRPDHLLRSVPFLGATGCHCPWLPCTVAPLDLSRGPGFSGRSSSIGRASSVSAGAAPRGVKAGAAAAAGSPPGPAAASTGWETAGASAAAAAARLACFASSFARSIALRASVFFRVRFGLEHRAPPPHAASPLLQHMCCIWSSTRPTSPASRAAASAARSWRRYFTKR